MELFNSKNKKNELCTRNVRFGQVVGKREGSMCTQREKHLN
jgi:hypothetical protein